MKSPLVSVITATFNMAQYIDAALDSILAQDYGNLEAVVIDDGSEDDTPSVLEKYKHDGRVRVFRQRNAGQTAAKNRGIAEARGDFIAFCDADNLWYPGKLGLQIPCFEAPDPPGVVYGDIQLIDGKGNDLTTPKVSRPSGRITAELLVHNFVPFNTCVLPRRVLECAGGFDESLTMGIDYDLWLRISVKHAFVHVPHKLAKYRIWPGQMSRRLGERLENVMRILEKFKAENPTAVTAKDYRRAIAYTYTTRGLWHASEARKEMAYKDFRAAIGKFPFDLRTWKSMVKLWLRQP